MSTRSIHQFAEKVALVSDAASPIGRAVSMQLALNGCFVVGLFPATAAGGSTVVGELTDLGTLAHEFRRDPWNEDEAAAVAADVDRLYGRLDILVNCLKFRPESQFQTIRESDFLDVLKINVGAVSLLTRSVFDLMKDRPKPKIVNVTSASDEPGDEVFTAAQAAIVSLTQSLSRSFPTNFRVNGVAVNDPQVASAQDDELPLRPGSATAPDDVARAILFLLSSESTLLNGETLRLG